MKVIILTFFYIFYKVLHRRFLINIYCEAVYKIYQKITQFFTQNRRNEEGMVNYCGISKNRQNE